MFRKHIIRYVILIHFVIVNTFVHGQVIDSLVLKEITLRVEMFYENLSIGTADTTKEYPDFVVNFVDFDSLDFSLLKALCSQTLFPHSTRVELSNNWRWFPTKFNTELSTDTINVLYIVKNNQDLNNFTIRFIYKYFILIDKENYFFSEIIDVNQCLPSIIVLRSD